MTFKPGQSGNPAGRAAENGIVKKLARAHAEKAIERLSKWIDSDNPKASVSSCIALLDRAYGKPAQTIAGDEDNPLNILVGQLKWKDEA